MYYEVLLTRTPNWFFFFFFFFFFFSDNTKYLDSILTNSMGYLTHPCVSSQEDIEISATVRIRTHTSDRVITLLTTKPMCQDSNSHL